ncbi:MAG: hypothetical protein JO053_04105 [Acidobacteria bacterium]|nr:hypothetical protein [Acidobacteriota bacterium]
MPLADNKARTKSARTNKVGYFIISQDGREGPPVTSSSAQAPFRISVPGLEQLREFDRVDEAVLLEIH